MAIIRITALLRIFPLKGEVRRERTSSVYWLDKSTRSMREGKISYGASPCVRFRRRYSDQSRLNNRTGTDAWLIWRASKSYIPMRLKLSQDSPLLCATQGNCIQQQGLHSRTRPATAFFRFFGSQSVFKFRASSSLRTRPASEIFSFRSEE